MREIARSLVYIGVFAVPFIPLIVMNSMFFPFITGKNFAFRIIVEIIFASWVVLALYDASYRPKFSWILGTFTAFIGVIFLADLLGEYPLKSFWSNFERMEGFVTLAHTYLYFVVIASVLTTEKLWKRFWYTSLFAALIMVLYGFAQLAGTIEIRQSDTRLDGLLGNSAYLAMYMCFHIFVAALYFFKTDSVKARAVFAGLIVLFFFIMLETETRGTAIGLVGGAIVTSLYVIMFGKKENPILRKTFIGIFAATVVFVGAVYALRDSPIVTSSSGLNRIANTSLGDLTTRLEIWTMAVEGVKERPILGWGQDNFNYVFNKYYDPSLYAQEAWFDRVHNIVMDWFIAAGFVGVVAYFSILGAVVYYLLVRPFVRKGDESFTVLERGILLGLFAAYTFHNFFVFDNVVSYMYYATFLAYVHGRVGSEIPKLMDWRVDARLVENIAVPIVSVALVATVYYVNVPGIQAAGGIIDAFTSSTPEAMLAEFDKALSRGSFGNQEIREQMTRQVQNVIQSPQAPEELKQKAFKRVEEELLRQVKEKPGDARAHVFISSFYRMTRNIEPAIEQLAIARSLSPKKQQIIFEQGLASLQKEDFKGAYNFFKEAYELDPRYSQAAIFYASSVLYDGKPEMVHEIINTDELMGQFSQSDFAIQAAYTAKQYELLKEMFSERIAKNPADPQLRVNLAVIYHESGDLKTAIETLRKGGEDIPSFKAQSEQFIADLEAGRLPGQKPEVTVGGATVEAKSE